ncbi:MAG: diguanylate cyclase [Bacillota bacterium]
MKIAVGVLYTLLPEILLLGVAALLAVHAGAFPSSGQTAVELGTTAILLAALGLSAQFNRSRVFFALLALFSSYLGLFELTRVTDPVVRTSLSGALGLFLPIDLLLFSGIGERGVFSRYGSLWFTLLAVEFMACWGMAAFPSPKLAQALHVEFVHLGMPALTRLTQPGLLATSLGLVWLNDRLLRRHSAETAAFFGALVATVPILHFAPLAAVAPFLAATGLACGYAVVQESWSMAYLDELTGLPGRRALEEQLRQLGGRYAIAMLDVDHFKHFNDRFGHDVGDQVLRFVASRLQQPALAGKPYRYGGEEFCMVYGGRGLAEISEELERLRADIESCRFDLRRGERRGEGTGPDADGNMLSITVSVGAAENNAEHDEPWTVLKAADQALYSAKHAGRNRVNLGGA